jgi:hypothetical protein
MAIYEYQLPSGQIVQVDAPTREKADNAFKEWQISNTSVEEFEPKLTAAQWLSDGYNSALSGITKYMVAGLASFPGTVERALTYLPGGQKTTNNKLISVSPLSKLIPTLSSLPSTGFDYAAALGTPEQFGKSESGRYLFPSYEQTLASMEKFIPGIKRYTQYQPKSRTGQYVETISGFMGPQAVVGAAPRVVSKLTGKGQTLGFGETARQTLSGAAAGATYEYFDYNTNNTLLSMGISLPVAMTVSALLAPSKAAKISADALKGVTKEEIALAVSLEKAANQQGIPMSAVELINSKVINALGETVYGTQRGGNLMYNRLKDRPDSIERVTQVLLNKIIKDPGTIREIYRKTSYNANKAIDNAKQIRTDKSYYAGYKLANEEFVPADKVLNIIDKIDMQIAKLPDGSPNILLLNKIKKRLFVPLTAQDKKLGLTAIPQTQINILDDVFKEFSGNIKQSNINSSFKSFINKQGRSLLFSQGDGILDDLKALMNTNQNYANANKMYANLSKDLVEFTTNNLDKLTKDVTSSKIKNFIFNPENASVIDVRNTYKLFNKTDKTQFPALARIYIENAANLATVMTPKGKSLGGGYNLFKSLAGSGNQKANFEEMLRGVAESNGIKNPNDFIKGFQNFNKILEKTARLGNIDTPAVQAEYQRGIVKSLAQINSFMWRLKLATSYGQFIERKTINQLSNILTDKNSVQQFVKLANENPNSIAAITRVRNIIHLQMPIMRNEEGFPINEEGQELPALQ